MDCVEIVLQCGLINGNNFKVSPFVILKRYSASFSYKQLGLSTRAKLNEFYKIKLKQAAADLCCPLYKAIER